MKCMIALFLQFFAVAVCYGGFGQMTYEVQVRDERELPPLVPPKLSSDEEDYMEERDAEGFGFKEDNEMGLRLPKKHVPMYLENPLARLRFAVNRQGSRVIGKRSASRDHVIRSSASAGNNKGNR